MQTREVRRDGREVAVAAQFLQAIGIKRPTVQPQVTPAPIGAFVIDWPTWQVFVTPREGARPGDPLRVRSLMRVGMIFQPPPAQDPPERATTLAKALHLPPDARLTVATGTQLQWERRTPGNYPHFQRATCRFSLEFHPKDRLLVQALDMLDLLDSVTLPSVRVGPDAALTAAQSLLTFGPGAQEPPLQAPALTWTPWLGELTPVDAERIWKRPEHRGGTQGGVAPRGPLRLAWLVTWSWCRVGVDSTNGKPVYFDKTTRVAPAAPPAVAPSR